MPTSFALLALALVAGAAPESPAEAAARLDALRLPAASFSARLDVATQDRAGGKKESWTFDLFARKTSSQRDATFDVLLRCAEPAADLGKRLLFTREGCWMQDPKAKRPVKVPAQQMWAQGSVADSLTWSLARDFEAADAGPDTLDLENQQARVASHCYEFTPRPSAAFAAGRMKWWLDDRGLALQSEHAIGGNRLVRTVQFTGYAEVLGGRHPVAMRTFARNEKCEITLSGHRALDVPAAWTDPAGFGTAGLPAGAPAR